MVAFDSTAGVRAAGIVLEGRGPMVPTFLGHGFHPFDPRPEEIFIEDIAQGLAHCYRFGGQARDGITVAQHSVLVAALLPPDNIQRQKEGLMHDGEESLGLPDMVTPAKDIFTQYKAVQTNIGHAVFIRFGLEWPEHPQVKLADRMALAIEKRDLVSENPDECWIPMPVPPSEFKVKGLESPIEARELFMWAFAELGVGRALTMTRLAREWPSAFGMQEEPSLEPA